MTVHKSLLGRATISPYPGRATGPLPPGFGPNSLTRIVHILIPLSRASLGTLTAQLLSVKHKVGALTTHQISTNR